MLLALLSACESTSAGGSVTPAEAEVVATATSVLVTLPDGRLIFEAEERLQLIDPRRPEQEPMVIGPATEVGTVHAAVPTRGAILVLASGGTFILRDAAWVPSPLADALDGAILDAVLVPTPTGRGLGDLWIATAASLYRVVDDRVERLDLGEDLSMAELAIAQRPEGPSLWVRLPDRVLEVWRDRTGALRSARLVLEDTPDAIGGDHTPRGWLVLGGQLHSIGADRRLVAHGIEVERLLTSPLSDDVWVWATDGSVWLHSADLFYEVDGVDVSASDTLALGVDGSLYAASATVRRFAPRRDVSIGGPADGSLVVSPQIFPIVAEGMPTLEATLDGAPIEVSNDPLQVELDPSMLEQGSHELVVRVVYDDGTLPTVERRSFEVVTSATWTDDVGPLYEAYCSACHGVEGPANTRLDTREDWESNFDAILVNVVEGRMPLGRPPLSQRDVALIEAWRVSGFTE